MDDQTQPQAITGSDFETIKPSADIQEKTQSGSGRLQEGFGIASNLFKAFKEDQPFSYSIIAIIGFIVIASFGHMTGWSDFLRYITMVILAVVMNSLLTSTVALGFSKKTIPWLLIVVLSAVIIFQNYSELIKLIKRIF